MLMYCLAIINTFFPWKSINITLNSKRVENLKQISTLTSSQYFVFYNLDYPTEQKHIFEVLKGTICWSLSWKLDLSLSERTFNAHNDFPALILYLCFSPYSRSCLWNKPSPYPPSNFLGLFNHVKCVDWFQMLRLWTLDKSENIFWISRRLCDCGRQEDMRRWIEFSLRGAFQSEVFETECCRQNEGGRGFCNPGGSCPTLWLPGTRTLLGGRVQHYWKGTREMHATGRGEIRCHRGDISGQLIC